MVIAARDLFAESGPSGVSLRAVAERVGCSHTFVSHQFGSKANLQEAVIERLADGLGILTTRLCSSDDWPIGELVTVLRVHPAAAKLLVRCALGEFDRAPLLRGHTIGACLADRLETRRSGSTDAPADAPSDTAKAAAFAALSLILGLVSHEDLIVTGSRATPIASDVRDAAMVQAAQLVAAASIGGDIELRFVERTPPVPAQPVDYLALDSRAALLQAALEIYGAHGPEAASTRAIADLAQVNQGLIYHYFGSREALLVEAFTIANHPLQKTVSTDRPLDLPYSARMSMQSRSLPLAARLLVNGYDLASFRTEFPVFDRLLAEFDDIPTGPMTTGLTDPRLAVMATSCFAIGRTLWEDVLREMIGIDDTVDLDPVVASVDAYLLRLPQLL
jgi:AcrR family transcriptional regulator